MKLRQGVPELRAEYKRRHDQLWPEMVAVLKSHGVHNYSIFLDPRADELFAYVEIESEERWSGIASTEVCQRWWRHMQDLMETNEDSSPLTLPLLELFHLD